MRNAQNLPRYPQVPTLLSGHKYKGHEGGLVCKLQPLIGEKGKDERHVSVNMTVSGNCGLEAFPLSLTRRRNTERSSETFAPLVKDGVIVQVADEKPVMSPAVRFPHEPA
jgi:hypothetical protein